MKYQIDKLVVTLFVLLFQIGCLLPSVQISKTGGTTCDRIPEVLIQFANGDEKAYRFFSSRKDEIGQFYDNPIKNHEDLIFEETKIRSKKYNWEFTPIGRWHISYSTINSILISAATKDPYSPFSRSFDAAYIINRKTGKITSFFMISGQGWTNIMVENNVVYIAYRIENKPTNYYCMDLIP
jgi:hypothetical protein